MTKSGPMRYASRLVTIGKKTPKYPSARVAKLVSLKLLVATLPHREVGLLENKANSEETDGGVGESEEGGDR